jgi:hypothetical protein
MSIATIEDLTTALGVPVETETVELMDGMDVVIRPITSFAVLAGIEKTARSRMSLLPAKPVLFNGEPIAVTFEMAQAAVMLSESVVDPKLTWDTACLLLHRYAVNCGRVLSRLNEMMGAGVDVELKATEAALGANPFSSGAAGGVTEVPETTPGRSKPN